MRFVGRPDDPERMSGGKGHADESRAGPEGPGRGPVATGRRAAEVRHGPVIGAEADELSTVAPVGVGAGRHVAVRGR